ncbi:MAG: hypothetical protein FWD15_05650 [Alphaproteobacteria bacterium]|nr:hypothetical protein [Alphaproteobacteria bacterium]
MRKTFTFDFQRGYRMNVPMRHWLESMGGGGSAVMFSITWHCNLACGHCGYSCSPKCAKEFMPKEHILYYLGQIAKNPDFKKTGYVISGGEPTTVYDYDPNYMRDIYKSGLEHLLGGNIKTNGWIAKSPHYGRFIDDLADVFEALPRAFCVELSADQYHDNFDENALIMTELYTNPRLQGMRSRLVCNFDYMLNNAGRWAETGIYDIKSNGEKIGNTALYSWENIDRTGRGKKIAGARAYEWKHEFYNMNFPGDEWDPGVGFHFIPGGKIALEIGFDISIAIPYIAPDGRLKPLALLRRELFDLAEKRLGGLYRRVLDEMEQNGNFGWREHIAKKMAEKSL